MSRRSALPRRAVLAAMLACATAPLAAQVTPAAPPAAPVPARRDTIPRPRRDTVSVPIPPEAQAHDTLPDKATHDSVPADSLRPAPNFPTWPEAPSGSWQGTWTLTRGDLAHYHGLSLVELLERVPGVLAVRTGSLGQPLGLSTYGLGGGRLRVFVDGYELLPLTTGVLDVQQVALADLQSVRVERALAGMRIDLTTYRQADRRPFAQIEAGDGDFSTRMLRGFFSRAMGGRDQFQGTFDLVSTGGYARQGPFDVTTFGARWTHLFGTDRAMQLEYRRQPVDRDLPSTTRSSVVLPFRESVDRTDVILRGRARVGSRLWLDAFAGRSSRVPAPSDSTSLEAHATQFGGRAALVSSFGTLNGEARLVRGQTQSFSPDETDLRVRLDLTPLSWLAATGEARSLTLGGVVGVETEASARIGPAAGFTAFATLAAGKRPLSFARDSVLTRRTFFGLGSDGGTVSDTSLIFAARSSTLTGLRLGGEFAHGTIVLGAAGVRLDPSQVAGYGLGFDAVPTPTPGAASNGVEGYGSLPLFFRWLRADGWYVRLKDTGSRPYLPLDFGAGALQYHATFFTGNLEPTARLEAMVRGPAAVPDSAGTFAARSQRYALFNFYLQIRVIDVSLFLRAENLVNRRTAYDVPGLPLPGYRAVYGFRWFFRN